MKTSELIKILRRSKQCKLIAHGKAHDKWYSNLTGKIFMVPRHRNKEIPIGTLNKILKNAEIKEIRK